MNVKLTPEQLEKAIITARREWYKDPTIVSVDGEENRRHWSAVLTAAFAAIEAEPVEVPGDLVEKSLHAWFSEQGTVSCMSPENVRKMTAALRVVLADPRVLGEPLKEEVDKVVRKFLGFGDDGRVDPDFLYGARLVLASRRARLTQPKTNPAEEAVQQFLGDTYHFRLCNDSIAKIVAIVRDVDAKLKEQSQ